MPQLYRSRITTMLGLIVCCALVGRVRADDWNPVTPAELQMTSEPQAPGAAAVYLYRQVDRDDVNFIEKHYERIKVLSEAGRKYGDVEIYFDKDSQHVQDIEARTISVNGTVSQFDGMVYDKPIVEGHGADVAARTFTLPGIEVGTIIEYRYTLRLRAGYVYNSQWILSQDLFTEQARFSLAPDTNFSMRMSWPRGLPPGTANPGREATSGLIRLQTQNVPAFVREDFMPPENELKYRVDFIYSSLNNREKEPELYWKQVGGEAYRRTADFLDRPKPMAQAVAQIVRPEDSPETRLRKIYARVQQLSNTTYAPPLTEEESKRQEATPTRNVEDVWQQGRGDAEQLNWLFVALARAAGVVADPALVPRRDSFFFDPRLMNPWRLNDFLVIVTLGGKDVFLDPGMPFTAFGQLSWEKTAVSALRLEKYGSKWLTTPLPAASDSLVERHASFKLASNDMLEGTITVRYTGEEALWRRDQERNEDETARQAFLERDLESSIPVGGTFKLTNAPDWKSAEAPLVAQFAVSIPGWGNVSGRRMLFSVGLFGNGEKSIFTSSSRTQPLYFSFPYRHIDDVTIQLPGGWSIESLPGARSTDLKGVVFLATAASENQALHLRRELTLNAIVVQASSYEVVRNFFEMVRSSDEDQAVLSPMLTATRP